MQRNLCIACDDSGGDRSGGVCRAAGRLGESGVSPLRASRAGRSGGLHRPELATRPTWMTWYAAPGASDSQRLQRPIARPDRGVAERHAHLRRGDAVLGVQVRLDDRGAGLGEEGLDQGQERFRVRAAVLELSVEPALDLSRRSGRCRGAKTRLRRRRLPSARADRGKDRHRPVRRSAHPPRQVSRRVSESIPPTACLTPAMLSVAASSSRASRRAHVPCGRGV